MRWIKTIFVLVNFLLMIGVINAQTSDELAKVGTTGAQFLKFSATARGAALANGLIVKVQDASSVFCNPAGLAHAEGISGFFSHTSLYMGMSYNSASVSYPLEGIGNVGVNLVHFSSGDIEETTIEQQSGTGKTFQFTDMALGLSYARRLTNRFSIGLNFRYIRENLANGLADDLVANNFSVDIGVLYLTEFKGLTLGMNIKNFGPQFQPSGSYTDWDNGSPIMDLDNPDIIEKNSYDKYHMPLLFQVGIGIDAIEIGPHKLTVFSVMEHPNDNIEVLNMAGEYTFNNKNIELALRSGYSFGHDVKGITAGAGLIYNGIKLDYALVDYGFLDLVNTFSITFIR
ncbi:MAG: PorV/PorQ family protein [Bacteroidetes bacterium]|nr:PorV/PorQ family protein [Bacteroidota bacterium]